VKDGLALQQAGRHREAIGKFQAALTLTETSATHFELGRSYYAIDDYAAALASFERAAALAGNDSERQAALWRIDSLRRLMAPAPPPPPTALQAIAQGRWVIERISLCSDPSAIFRLELQGTRVIWRKGPAGSHGVFVEEVQSDTPSEARTVSVAAPDVPRANSQTAGTRWRYLLHFDGSVRVEPSNLSAFTIVQCPTG
jgi:tetratricopeptide (TPR) repeat protein